MRVDWRARLPWALAEWPRERHPAWRLRPDRNRPTTERASRKSAGSRRGTSIRSGARLIPERLRSQAEFLRVSNNCTENDLDRNTPGQARTVGVPKRWADLIRWRAASTSRSRAGAFVVKSASNRSMEPDISAMAASQAAELAAEGCAKPLTLRTNWRAAASISFAVAGGSKLNSGRIFRHIACSSH